MANIYTPELKKQHVDDWRCSGLTRREYAALHAINFNTFKHWPAQLATLSLKIWFAFISPRIDVQTIWYCAEPQNYERLGVEIGPITHPVI